MLWLGGDLAFLTSINDEAIAYVNSILRLDKETTLWSLGNHDYSDLLRVESVTNRPPYYAYNRNGIIFVVLDTQDSLSSIVGTQKTLFENIIDTIQESSHLVLLHHKLIWLNDGSFLESQIPLVSNGHFGDCFHCINQNNFYEEIYPSLVEVQNKGIEVICIGGDIGLLENEFQHKTNDGIMFLASGIHDLADSNKALLFKHNVTNNILTWKYRLIMDLD